MYSVSSCFAVICYELRLGLALIHCTNMYRADKGDTIKVSGVYHLDWKQKASAVAEFTRKLSTNENALTVGGLYTVDPQTTVKARLNNTGTLAALSALLQHEVKQKSLLTISGEFDTKALDRPQVWSGIRPQALIRSSWRLNFGFFDCFKKLWPIIWYADLFC